MPPLSMTGSQARPVRPVGEPEDEPRLTSGLERVLEMGRGRLIRPSLEEWRALQEAGSSFERHLC